MNCYAVFDTNIAFIKIGGTVESAKSAINTFNSKWGDRDFGGALTEGIKEDAARMFRLNEMYELTSRL
jgi:hypothetical protein